MNPPWVGSGWSVIRVAFTSPDSGSASSPTSRCPSLVRSSTFSRWAGLTLCWFARVGTHDATSSFKAYDRAFVQEVGIESDAGFELALELVAKARRHRRPVAEIPTLWLERTDGASNFKMWKWLPRYFHWYFYAFGPKIK